MPSRVIRDGVLDSHRYHEVDKPARLAFLELLLCADDYGCVPLSGVYLKRHTTAFEGVPQGAADGLLLSLTDVDLLRVYEVEGARFGFIPRFGNTPRAKKPKWPLPPDAMGGKEIKDLVAKMHGRCTASAVHVHASAPETETETETGTETVEETGQLTLAPARQVAEQQEIACPHLEILALWSEVLPAMPRHKPSLWRGARADHLRARWRETATEKGWKSQADGLAFFRKFFGYVGRSPFLTGRAGGRDGRPAFQAELDWIVRPQSWAKVIEGKYHQEA